MPRRISIREFSTDATFPLNVIRGTLSEPYEAHTHDFHELFFILGGSCEQIVDGKPYIAQAGDVYVLGSDTSHEFTKVNQLDICNVQFDHQAFLGACEDLRKLAGFQCLFVLEPDFAKTGEVKSSFHLDLGQLASIRSHLERMLKEQDRAAPGHRTMLRALFMELATTLSRLYVGREDRVSSGLLRLGDAVAFMERSFLEPISVGDMAEKAGLSRRHFIRVFKQAYGTTPIDYVLVRRIQHASHLLLSTDESIGEIAYASGFADSNYFSRKFREIVGSSPREFRNSQGDVDKGNRPNSKTLG